jgi:hypothetical protein
MTMSAAPGVAYDFLQLCYVTNDFERAIAELRTNHRIGPFLEMREHRVPTGPGKTAIGHFGLAFKAHTQFEVIEPVDGDVGIYRDMIAGKNFQMRFHHTGRHIASEAEYQQTLEQGKSRWKVPVDMAGFGGRYAYLDARAEYGHYLELMCFPLDSIPFKAPRY